MDALASPPVDLLLIVRPGNATAVLAALNPAFSIDFNGMAALVSYRFGQKQLLVAHGGRVPGAGASSFDLVKALLSFITAFKQKAPVPTVPTWIVANATKDLSTMDRFFELVGYGRRGIGRVVVAFPALTAIAFSEAGQATAVDPIFSEIPRRGRFSYPCWSVPTLEMYVRLRGRPRSCCASCRTSRRRYRQPGAS